MNVFSASATGARTGKITTTIPPSRAVCRAVKKRRWVLLTRAVSVDGEQSAAGERRDGAVSVDDVCQRLIQLRGDDVGPRLMLLLLLARGVQQATVERGEMTR